MRFISKILLLCTLIILVGCDHKVKFSSAMPPDVEALSSMPDNFQGVFMCESDSSKLYIDRYTAVKESHYMFETSINQVKETENCSLTDGGLYLPGRKECIPFEYISDDSISAKVYELDTIFSFAEGQVAKYYKGHLFVNYQNDKAEWDTWIFSPQENGNVIFEFVAVPDDEQEIKDVTKNFITRKDDRERIHFTLSPTLKEFEVILNKDFLFECETLVPVNFER